MSPIYSNSLFLKTFQRNPYKKCKKRSKSSNLCVQNLINYQNYKRKFSNKNEQVKSHENKQNELMQVVNEDLNENSFAIVHSFA